MSDKWVFQSVIDILRVFLEEKNTQNHTKAWKSEGQLHSSFHAGDAFKRRTCARNKGKIEQNEQK